MATRVEAAQEGPDEAMNQALAASSAREAPVASSARNVRPRTAQEHPTHTVENEKSRSVRQ